MPHFIVQVTRYGFTTIEATDADAAKDQAEQMPADGFNMSKDLDIEILDECDENGSAI